VTLGFAINALAEATIYTSLLDEDLRCAAARPAGAPARRGAGR